MGMRAGTTTWAEIDLDAIASNVSAFKKHVGEKVEIFAVVKANAYGHGAAPVARAALDAGAARLAVHRSVEGVELRQARIEAPILIMGYTPPDGAKTIVRWRLTPSLIDMEVARALSFEAAGTGATVPVHIKVDTGMSRWGLMPGEVVEFIRALRDLPYLRLEGIFTHLATADWRDTTHVLNQMDVFNRVLSDIRHAGFDVPVIHAANSAAAMRLPTTHCGAVRIGIAMYGMEPSSEWPSVFQIHPALTLKSAVSRVRKLPPGSGISYGRTFIAQQSIIAALVPVGYGDGYHRSLSNRGCVLIRGQRAPIVGRICMDQCVVDATNIPGVMQHDEVVLIGRQGQEVISVEEVARLAGTINYEVTTSLLPRVSRLHLRKGQIVSSTALAG
jgi:alanine racemase